MSEQTMAAMVAQAEGLIALARMADALRLADMVDIRFSPGDPQGVGARREVVFSFQSAADAEAFFTAARRAAGTT